MKKSTGDNLAASRTPTVLHILVGCLLLTLAVAIDFVSGPNTVSTIFYLVPVSYVALSLNTVTGVLAALISAGLWLMSDMVSYEQTVHPVVPLWNALAQAAVFILVSLVLTRLRSEVKRQRTINDELQSANERILRLSQARSDFCAMVSHELRTPMATVREGLRLVADGFGDGMHDEQKEYLRMTQENVERLIRLANQILDFSSLEANAFRLRLLDVDVNKLIQEHATFVDPQVKTKGLHIRLELAPNLPAVRGDPAAIAQILANLVSNAIKHTDKGEIAILSKPQDGFIPAPGSVMPSGVGFASCLASETPGQPAIAGKGVLVSVRDTGRGIRGEVLRIIFEPFNALKRTEVSEDGGTGLGLAITGRLVAMHGGLMAISSAEGRGTKADVFLPLNGCPDAAPHCTGPWTDGVT